nr:hypothetical protein [Vibrio parahaemolyticus]
MVLKAVCGDIGIALLTP